MDIDKMEEIVPDLRRSLEGALGKLVELTEQVDIQPGDDGPLAMELRHIGAAVAEADERLTEAVHLIAKVASDRLIGTVS